MDYSKTASRIVDIKTDYAMLNASTSSLIGRESKKKTLLIRDLDGKIAFPLCTHIDCCKHVPMFEKTLHLNVDYGIGVNVILK